MDFTVCVVDDDALFAECIRRKLLIQGYKHVYVFNSGRGFLREIDAKPDIVFLDYDLGDMTGIDVLLKIKEYSPLTQVIMISGQKEQTVVGKVKNLGVHKYISKANTAMNEMIDEAVQELVH